MRDFRLRPMIGSAVATVAALASLLLLWVPVPVTFDISSTAPQRERGFAWYVDLPKLAKSLGVEGDTSEKPQRSPARLLEDGKPLGPAHSMHESIRSAGAGRFSDWHGGLYFSSSDGSDVGTNKRKYSLRVGVHPPTWALAIVLAGAIGFLVARHRQRLSWSALRQHAERMNGPGEGAQDPPQPPRGLAILLAAIVVTACYQGYRSPDWEVLTTKHYWNSQGFHYGGYADVFAQTPSGLRAIQKESLIVYNNLFPFSENVEPSLRKNQVAGWPSTERLAVPFAAYLVISLTRGLVDVWSAFFVLNVVLWLSAIFFAHRLASFYFRDPYSPLFAGLLVALYPAFTLHFYAIKIAYINIAFLLGGMYVFETALRERPAHVRLLVLAAIFFLGQFAVGGWLFLFVFLFVRMLGMRGAPRLAHLATLFLALVAALVALSYLRRTYLLPSVEQQMSNSLVEIFLKSYEWVRAWLRGEDVAGHKFLNHAGFSFFTGYFPLVTLSFIRGHWALMSLFLFAVVLLPAARKFVLPFVLLACVGHGGFVLTQWTFHYGYLSAPAAMMMILPAAGLLGMLASRDGHGKRALAGVLLVAVLVGFMDQKLHAGLYYGGYVEKYLQRIVIHYGESDDIVEY